MRTYKMKSEIFSGSIWISDFAIFAQIFYGVVNYILKLKNIFHITFEALNS